MRFEIEDRSVRNTRGIAHGRWQLQDADVPRPIDQPQVQMNGRGAAIGALERRRQRLEQAREHERQRLEAIDRPFELDLFEKAWHVGIGHERADIDAQRQTLERHASLPQPRRQLARWQRRQLAERRQSPSRENRKGLLGRFPERGGLGLPRRTCLRAVAPCISAHT